MRARLSRLSNRMLLALTLSIDVVVFGGGGYLERVSLRAAANPSSTSALILWLLAANFALFGLVIAGLTVNGLLISRVLRRFFSQPSYVKVERGVIETNEESVSR